MEEKDTDEDATSDELMALDQGEITILSLIENAEKAQGRAASKKKAEEEATAAFNQLEHGMKRWVIAFE